jgi:hypothetical protein
LLQKESQMIRLCASVEETSCIFDPIFSINLFNKSFIAGQQITSGKVSSENHRINLNGLNKGIYLISVSEGNGKLIKKVVLR